MFGRISIVFMLLGMPIQVAASNSSGYSSDYCSQSQEKFNIALEAGQDDQLPWVLSCFKAGLEKGYHVPTHLHDKYKAKVEAHQKMQLTAGVSRKDLVMSCRISNRNLMRNLRKYGIDPVGHPLVKRSQELLRQLEESEDMDALLLMTAGKCGMVGEIFALLDPKAENFGAGGIRPTRQQRLHELHKEQDLSHLKMITVIRKGVLLPKKAEAFEKKTERLIKVPLARPYMRRRGQVVPELVY